MILDIEEYFSWCRELIKLRGSYYPFQLFCGKNLMHQDYVKHPLCFSCVLQTVNVSFIYFHVYLLWGIVQTNHNICNEIDKRYVIFRNIAHSGLNDLWAPSCNFTKEKECPKLSLLKRGTNDRTALLLSSQFWVQTFIMMTNASKDI